MEKGQPRVNDQEDGRTHWCRVGQQCEVSGNTGKGRGMPRGTRRRFNECHGVFKSCTGGNTRMPKEARSKAEDSDREFFSATQRVEALATLLCKCVYQVAPGNPDRLDHEQTYFNWILKNMMLEERIQCCVECQLE